MNKDNLADLVSDPHSFFGEGTDVIEVESPSGELRELSSEPRALRGLHHHQRIPSGTKIVLDNYLDDYQLCWMYMPYNYRYAERATRLYEELESKGIDVNQLEVDENYRQRIIVEKRRALQRAYAQLQGAINQNSMFVLSIPCGRVRRRVYLLHRHFLNGPDCRCCCDYRYCREEHYSLSRGGCLYTGDGDLNVVNPEQVFQSYWGKVGTVQIPHHGDIKAYSAGWGRKRKFCCVISYGLNNNYGHPSWTVVADITANGNLPVEVTEEQGFVERIELECENDRASFDCS